MTTTLELTLTPKDNERLQNICGPLDAHLKQIEGRLAVEISNRGHYFKISGTEETIKATETVLQALYLRTKQEILTPAEIHLQLQQANIEITAEQKKQTNLPEVIIKTRKGLIRPRGDNQKHYLHSVVTHDISFAVGPAGTGKTWLAVACAVEALERQNIRRIILVRPAVEAGERLGFLPGDLSQKVDPYLRPLYDALFEMLGFEKVEKLIEHHVIEVAPLAYMRGRTLNDAFIIMDEAQNTTREQMKMFLTRIGFGSKAVITGDITQIDLPSSQQSGLKQAVALFQETDGISFTFFESKDVVRHPLVQRIVNAYDKADQKQNAG